MTKDGCIMPKCKGADFVDYKGNQLCEKHWEALCNGDMEVQKKLIVYSHSQ